jgi:DNA-binding NarL/FixJ family response regulator
MKNQGYKNTGEESAFTSNISIMKILVYSKNNLLGIGLSMQLNKWKGVTVVNTFNCIDEALISLKIGQKPDVLILNQATFDSILMNTIQKFQIAIGPLVPLIILTDVPGNFQSEASRLFPTVNFLSNAITPEDLKRTLYSLPLKKLSCTLTTDAYHLKKRISEREMIFLSHLCSEEEYTYEQIADKMSVHVRTVDGFRKSLFQKLSIKSKTGLVMLAIRNNWV